VRLDSPPGHGTRLVVELPCVSCEVFALIAPGRGNAGIARLLGISEKSVVAHTPRIYDALGLATDVDDHAASSRWSGTRHADERLEASGRRESNPRS
jgi:DNA-binding NarL/FixJ family response regulator